MTILIEEWLLAAVPCGVFLALYAVSGKLPVLAEDDNVVRKKFPETFLNFVNLNYRMHYPGCAYASFSTVTRSIKMTKQIVLIVALALVSSVALAAKHHKPTGYTEQGRNWSQIDTNHDNLISPEEMEKWLAANPGPLKK
ncbi:MAG TPA: hypothetical protein VNN78_04835 [Burkholderiales bacterium]|nr:hypothetical protein [Burkholderiales bacterium]